MAFEFTEVDITKIIRGDTFDVAFRIGTDFPILRSMRIKAQVREFYDSPEAILLFDSTDGSIVIDGQYIRLIMAASAMMIPVKRYCYDVQFMSLGGETTTVFGGKFYIQEDYTR